MTFDRDRIVRVALQPLSLLVERCLRVGTDRSGVRIEEDAVADIDREVLRRARRRCIQAKFAGAATPGSQQDFTVNVGDRLFFDTDSTSIRADAQQTLDRQAQWLAKYPNYAVTVEGHADERGTREYNLALGARRAASTKDYLISRVVPANRLKTISSGKEKPVAVCDDISCWSQNRRAVTVLGGAGM